jgi:replicative DNA helicase
MPNGTAAMVIADLERRNIRFKKESERHYRSDNPLRGGSNSFAFHLLITGDESGAYYDHAHPEDYGSLYDLADALGLVPQGAHRVAESKRVYKNLADYAQAHGVDAAVFAAAKWTETSYEGRPAFTFPTADGNRLRFTDGSEPAYKWAGTGHPCWYGLAAAAKRAQDEKRPLVICNGEASTVVAQHLGLPAACVTGGEKGDMKAPLLEALKKAYPTGEIRIAFDCDKTGRTNAPKLEAQLKAAGYGAKAINLGLSKGGDLADFCRLYSEDVSAALAKCGGLSEPLDKETVEREVKADDVTVLADGVRNLATSIRNGAETDIETLVRLQKQINTLIERKQPPEVISMSDVVDEVMGEIDTPSPDFGLNCRLSKLNEAIGAIQEGWMVDTNSGKSTLAATWIADQQIADRHGLVVPTEMKPRRYIAKIVAAMTGINWKEVFSSKLTPEDRSKVREALSELRTITDFLKGSKPTISQIESAVRRRAAEKCPYEYLVIDSITRISTPGYTSLYDRMSAAADGLQALAVDYDVPVIITNQLGRKTTGRKNQMPQLHDGYGSGVVEQNCDVLVGLYDHNQYCRLREADRDESIPPGMILLQVLKHREGYGGDQAVKVKLDYGIQFRDWDYTTKRIYLNGDGPKEETERVIDL